MLGFAPLSGAPISATADAGTSYTGTIAVTLAFVAAFTGTQGYTGTISPTLRPIMAATGAQAVSGTLAATILPVSAFSAAHGVSGVLGGALPISTAFTGGQTINGTIAATLAPIMAAEGNHHYDITGTLAAVVTFTPAITGSFGTVVDRFSLTVTAITRPTLTVAASPARASLTVTAITRPTLTVFPVVDA